MDVRGDGDEDEDDAAAASAAPAFSRATDWGGGAGRVGGGVDARGKKRRRGAHYILRTSTAHTLIGRIRRDAPPRKELAALTTV